MGILADDGYVYKDGKIAGIALEQSKRKLDSIPLAKSSNFTARQWHNWGWTEKEYIVPYPLFRAMSILIILMSVKVRCYLLPNFRLPTLIHTRSANAKWLVRNQP